MSATLEGLLVIAVEQAVAAPFCTSRLADAGARVIKIERPEGDFARGYDDSAAGQSSYFVWLNRGKQSITLDLSNLDDKALLRAMIAHADVLVQNLKPGAMARLGLSIESLRAAYPRLIACSITGYGDSGPLAERKAYDLLIQAECGLASVTGRPEGPGRVGLSVVDIATGAAAHAAILEALIARERSGEGADIRVSMFDVMADWMTVPLLNTEAGKPPQRLGLAHPSVAPYGAFKSRDGRDVLISIQNDREWRWLCAGVLGDDALGTDSRFATNVARVRNRAETDALVARTFVASDADELVARLVKADIAFALVNSVDDLSRHPHLRRVAVETRGGTVRYPAPGAISGAAPSRLGAVPQIGEHSAAIRAEFAS
ncbi:MAG: CaiB/BaiF CoA-transferase family protein [Beijerinckiaceae bacterium]